MASIHIYCLAPRVNAGTYGSGLFPVFLQYLWRWFVYSSK